MSDSLIIKKYITNSKLLLYLVFIVLPLNLGLHFIIPQAYVGGLLIDYLVPTIFIQDIAVLILLIRWLLNYDSLKNKFYTKYVAVLVLLLYVVFLSVLTVIRYETSVLVFMRWFVYALFSIFVMLNFDFKKDFYVFIKISCYWVIFLSLLGIAQFIKQGALFNNYLVLGEQPYSAATPLIDKANVFGSAYVPAYGLFRHPNIFGGYLSILLVIVFYAFRTKFIAKRLFFITQVLGMFVLILTFSYFSWASYILGMLFTFVENKALLKKLLLSFVLTLCAGSFFINKINFPDFLASNPSVYKRVELLNAGYSMVHATRYLFGVGLNQSTAYIESYMLPTNFIRFVQPPHNMFVLIAAEIGLIGLLLFLYLFFSALLRAYFTRPFLFVALLQLMFLSCFDHYFVTIPQTFLLLWLLLGLVFA